MGGGFSWRCSVLERKIHFWVLIQSLLSFLQEGKGGGIFGHLRKERKKYKIYSRAQSALYFILWDLHHFHSPQRGGWGCTFSECQKEALGWRGLAWEGRWKRLYNSERKTKCSSTLLITLLCAVLLSWTLPHNLALQLVSHSNIQH